MKKQHICNVPHGSSIDIESKIRDDHLSPINSKGVANIDLLVICHAYNNFQKDSIESLYGYFKEINALVRTNPFAELSSIIPWLQLERFRKGNKLDLTRKPQNVNVISTPLCYFPGDIFYKSIGDGHFNAVKKQIDRKKLRLDVVHSHFTWSAGYVGARLKEEYNVPFVVTAHGYDIYSLPFRDNGWRKKIEYVLNTADHIITVSHSNLGCIKKLDISTPVTVIPNGFSSGLFYPRDPLECKKKLDLPQDKKIILSVGNLVPVKGQKYLIEAMKAIVRERRDVLCIIVGSGALRKKLERQVRSLGLEDHVMIAGGKPHDEIPIWMNACDVFVLPSIRESFGVVQIEAMACGKPVAATRNGGSEEVITSDDHGLLVEPADPYDLAEKIQLALDREWDREAILQYAERYTWENVAKDIMSVYDEVTSRSI